MTRVYVRAAHDGSEQHLRDQGRAPRHPVCTVARRVSTCCAHQRGGTSPWSPAVGSRPISSRGRLSNPPPLSMLPDPRFACVTGYFGRGQATVFGISQHVKSGVSPSVEKGASWRNSSLGEQVYEFDPDPDANQGKRVLRGQQVEATEADGGISKALSRLRWLLRKVSHRPKKLPTINPHTPPPLPLPPCVHTAGHLELPNSYEASLSSGRGWRGHPRPRSYRAEDLRTDTAAGEGGGALGCQCTDGFQSSCDLGRTQHFQHRSDESQPETKLRFVSVERVSKHHLTHKTT